jgi:hypothetical protein
MLCFWKIFSPRNGVFCSKCCTNLIIALVFEKTKKFSPKMGKNRRKLWSQRRPQIEHIFGDSFALIIPWANCTIAGYNASSEKVYHSTNSLEHFGNKNFSATF